MQQMPFDSTSSWLSLVAETAGVSGATIARIELGSRDLRKRSTRVIVQIWDRWGQVMGASCWYGDGRELANGVFIDLGFELDASEGASVVAWQEESCEAFEDVDFRFLNPPPQRVCMRFEPLLAMKLMLEASAPAIAAAA